MGAYSSVKTFWDRVTSPLVFGGWLLAPFLGASANAAELANPDPASMGQYKTDNAMGVFYGLVMNDIPGAIKGMWTFVQNAAQDTAVFGGHILSGLGVNSGAGALATAFNFASGAVVFGGALYAASMATKALLEAKPQPAMA